jgi:3-oxoacyl-[acyl-carrier protein] reductase
VAADVTDPATPARLVDAALERFGALHVVVANAGGPPQARALETDDEGMLAAVNANMLTSIRLVEAAVPPPPGGGLGPHLSDHLERREAAHPHARLLERLARGLWAWAKTAAQDLIDDGITLNLACRVCTPPTGSPSSATPAAWATPTSSARW